MCHDLTCGGCGKCQKMIQGLTLFTHKDSPQLVGGLGPVGEKRKDWEKKHHNRTDNREFKRIITER